MTVTRHGIVRTMEKPSQLVTDTVCALSKMPPSAVVETALRLRQKSPQIADMLELALYRGANT